MAVAVGLGKAKARNGGEAEDARLKELTRVSAAKGTLALKAAGSKAFAVDPLYSAHAAAVGAELAAWSYTLKTTTDALEKAEPVEITPLGEAVEPALESDKASSNRIALDWATGKCYAEAQNTARTLMETPANRLTPTLFCDKAAEQLKGLDNVTFEAHDLAWAEEKKMGSFISVSRGSSQPLRFLEAHYKGAGDAPPVALVGKGITFDTGGISLKPGANMKEMKGDMGGAAVTYSAFVAAAKLRLPINVSLFIALTENMPGPAATKPGDIVTAANGVTIEVDNTDAEGRLVRVCSSFMGMREFCTNTISSLNRSSLTRCTTPRRCTSPRRSLTWRHLQER